LLGASSLSGKDYKREYDKLLYSDRMPSKFVRNDNLAGSIVWNESYLLESMLNMYENTGDIAYLHVFVNQISAVAQRENGVTNTADDDGIIRRGWQTGGHYSFSQPLNLLDRNGGVSLRVTAKRWGHNNYTTVQVAAASDTGFTIKVRNTRTKFSKDFENVSMRTVEKKVNGGGSMSEYIYVEKRGESMPRPTGVLKLETQKITLTAFNNPRLLAPMLRFAYIVENRDLNAFRRTAGEALEFAEEIMASYDDLWNENGYFENETGIPFSYAGLPVPYNILADHGRVYLFHSLLTNNSESSERLDKILERIDNGFSIKSDSTKFFYNQGALFNGWTNSTKYNYKKHWAANRIEDTAHFCSTIYFLHDMRRNNKLDNNELAERVRKVFWQSYSPTGMSYNIDGSGNKNNLTAPGIFILFADGDARMKENCNVLFQKHVTDETVGVYSMFGMSNMVTMGFN